MRATIDIDDPTWRDINDRDEEIRQLLDENKALSKKVAMGEKIKQEILADHLRLEWLSEQVCEIYAKDKMWPMSPIISAYPGSESLRLQIDGHRNQSN